MPAAQVTRPATQDRRRKSVTSTKPIKRSLNTIHINGDYAACTCGWDTSHARKKVFDRRIDKHAEVKHNNRVIYM